MSAILKLVECDGVYYIDKRDGRRLAHVSDARTAAVFEVGRMMRQWKVLAW